MKALFDSSSKLVGWISDDDAYIFDMNLRWAGYVVADNAWNSRSGRWIGPVINGNLYDQSGHPFAWSNSNVASILTPMRPTTPLKPLTPMTPLRPLTPLTPLTLMTPLGGWSQSSFAEAFK
jgi:hypothetical protein